MHKLLKEFDSDQVKSVASFVDYLNNLYSYDFNRNEKEALISMALTGVDLEALVKDGKRSKFQIGCKIKSFMYQDGKKSPELVLRRIEEYKLYTTPIEKVENPKKPARKRKKEA